MDSHLSTRQIAEALQVSESSVKRWCDRGVIPMVRTAGGHRRVMVSAFMNYLVETNQEIATHRLPLACRGIAPQESKLETVEILKCRFRDGLLAGDEIQVREAMIHYLGQRDCIASLSDELIARAFHEIGEQWCAGKVEVYQERRASDICSRILHEIRRFLPNPLDSAPLAIGGTIEGDQYQLPTQLISLVFLQNGWRSMNLGAHVPLESIAAAVAKHRPKILWLSISHIVCESTFLTKYQDFHSGLPADLSVVLGGRALHDQLRPKLRYTGFCDNLQQLSSLANAISGVRSRVSSAELPS
jgi:MerR family transcriptional regulator, light-induced transcriptional regulator